MYLGLVQGRIRISSLPADSSHAVVGLQMSGSTGWGYIGETSSQRLRAYTAGFSAAISVVAGIVMGVLYVGAFTASAPPDVSLIPATQRSLYAQRESMELEPQDSMVLRRSGGSFCGCVMVLDS